MTAKTSKLFDVSGKVVVVYYWASYCEVCTGDFARMKQMLTTHGAKGMEGGLCVNEWLIRQGYLVLNTYPSRPTKFAALDVDWSRTRAWGEGGHYARIFLNVQGRESQGVIPPAEYEAFRDRLKKALGR